jgi:hypothetical protein
MKHIIFCFAVFAAIAVLAGCTDEPVVPGGGSEFHLSKTQINAPFDGGSYKINSREDIEKIREVEYSLGAGTYHYQNHYTIGQGFQTVIDTLWFSVQLTNSKQLDILVRPNDSGRDRVMTIYPWSMFLSGQVRVYQSAK